MIDEDSTAGKSPGGRREASAVAPEDPGAGNRIEARAGDVRLVFDGTTARLLEVR